MALRAYIDDSGFHGSAPAYLFAGFVTTTRAAGGMEVAWRQALVRAPYRLRSFKANHAQMLKGEFAGWTREEVERLRLELAEVVVAHAEYLYTKETRVADFNATVAPLHAEHGHLMRDAPLRNSSFSPYFQLLPATLHVLLQIAARRGDTIDFVFDSQPENEETARALWSYLPASLDELGRPEMKEFIGTMTFGTEQEVVLLQAADMIVWHENRQLERGRIEGMQPAYRRLLDVPRVVAPSEPELLRAQASHFRATVAARLAGTEPPPRSQWFIGR